MESEAFKLLSGMKGVPRGDFFFFFGGGGGFARFLKPLPVFSPKHVISLTRFQT